ncbi:MAG: 3'-5' exonuclease [Deltaproteobacteria bacterium]
MTKPNPKTDLDVVQPGTLEAAVIDEELTLLTKVQKQLAQDELDRAGAAGYDTELIALRDQIAEARVEDLAPLIAEMYRMQALGAANGKGRSLPVDAKCPYFGHLKLNDGKKVRDVLIGSRAFVKPGSEVAIVDWRNAPVSRIYYCYEEGDDYDEQFGNRPVSGIVEARRTVSIVQGELRRVTWATGSVARRGDGTWVSIPIDRRPTLAGGAGVASRPPSLNEPPAKFEPGQLGVVGDESLREDKHLREITALIDPKQFELITQPESGIVILQGGAGSGKTTVALHRAAYLHFADPATFSAKKMAVVVKSAPLTEYISRVLPSLDVGGTQVVTLEDWMKRTRKKVLPELKQKYVRDVPAAVSKLKKHPGVLNVLELGVDREADGVREQLAKRADAPAKNAVVDKWDGIAKLALLPRIREMSKWLEGAAASRAGVTSKSKNAMLGALRRARSAASDVHAAWADLLTDRKLIAEAVLKRRGAISREDIDELVKWVGMQCEDEPSKKDDDDGGRGADKQARAEAERQLGFSAPREKKPSNEEDYGVGIDGRQLDEDLPYGRLDEHDDALLLKLTQLKYGGLPIAGSNRTVSYEHVIVDEAQDLSPTDIGVLRGALTKRESMTLAGDTAQKLIFDNGFDTWESMLEDVGISGVTIDQLRISYRSTQQIVDFARHVLGPLADPEAPIVPRSGAPVEQFTFGSTGEAIAFLGESLRSLVLRERKANIAVVARYAAQADIYYGGLKKSEVPSLRRVYGKDFTFAPGIDVVDVTQIKGLEYDYVVLAEVNNNTYPAMREARHLLHIAATRAVHQLWVTSVSDPSPLLPEAL